MKRYSSLLFLFSLLSTWVQAAPTIPETSDLREPMMRAIDSNREVEVNLTGEIAEKIRLQTKAPANTRVKAKISTVSVIRPGCKRLRLEFSEPTHKMKTVNGTEEPFLMWYEMNICSDGKPPQLSMVGLTKEQVKERLENAGNFNRIEQRGGGFK